MINATEQIRLEKENKIKLLLSEFELCKQKIFQHKRDQRPGHSDQQLIRKPRSVIKRAEHQSRFNQPSLEETRLRLRLEKVEAALAESELVFQEREQELLGAIKQEQSRHRLFVKGYSETVSCLRDLYGRKIQEIQPDKRIAQRLDFYEEKLGCLNALLLQVRTALSLSEEGRIREMEEVVKEKLELEYKCNDYEAQLQNIDSHAELRGLQDCVQDLQSELSSRDEVIKNLQKEFRQETKQYMKKIEEARSGNDGNTRHEVELVRGQYAIEVKMRGEQQTDYQQRLGVYNKRVEQMQARMHSNELEAQKEISRLLMEIKRLNQQVNSLQEENKKGEELQNLKDAARRFEKQKEKSKDKEEELKVHNGIRKQLQSKLSLANKEATRLRQQVKVMTQARGKLPELGSSPIGKQSGDVQTELYVLRECLDRVTAQLTALKQGQTTDFILQTPPKRKSSIDQAKINAIQQRNRQLQQKILECQDQLRHARKQVGSYQQKQIGSQRELEEKQQVIDTLKERKVGFQNLFIEMERSNQQLRDNVNSDNSNSIDKNIKGNQNPPKSIKNPIQDNLESYKDGKAFKIPIKKRQVQNAIQSSIKDLDIRLIDSDPEEVVSDEDRLEDIKEQQGPNDRLQPPTFKDLHPGMNYSFNPANMSKIERDNRTKRLESEISLLKQENQRLVSRKDHLQSQLKELETQEDYFIEQKQILKGQLAAMLAQNHQLKQLARKLLGLLAMDSKSLIKSSLPHLRKLLQELFFIIKDCATLEKQVFASIDSKKGFFSIL